MTFFQVFLEELLRNLDENMKGEKKTEMKCFVFLHSLAVDGGKLK